MSGYRGYNAWNKSSTSSYSGSSSKADSNSTKYDPVYSRTSTDTKRSDGSLGLRLGQKYNSYNSGYQHGESSSKDAGNFSGIKGASVTTRLKDVADKKDASHPPVSYRPISRTGNRSRDPSAERDINEKQSFIPHTYNKLYPTSYSSRSTSLDRTDSTSTSSISTIPKYTGRSSLNKTDQYSLGRSSISESKEDLTSNKFKTSNRTLSREDLDSSSNKYISSRFLPKNTIEKSNTAYIRPTSTRIASSQSRKNRELLNLLSTQNDLSKNSKTSVGRPSSYKASDDSTKEKQNTEQFSDSKSTESVVKTVSKTSSNLPVQKNKKPDSLKLTEKHLPEENSSKSESLSNNCSKSSKFSRSLATPLSSYLDLKFSSPDNDSKSSKETDNASSKCHSKNTNNRKSSPKSTTKTTSKSPQRSSQGLGSSRKLPPQIPAFIIPNKDFRKSVLNMNSESKFKKLQHSGSASSAESEIEIPLSEEATDVSENLSSCVSFHKTSSPINSRLSKEHTASIHEPSSGRSNTCSPNVHSEGSTSSTATSSSEDDAKAKSSKSKIDGKQTNRNLSSSRTTISVSFGDDSLKPPMSPRPKVDQSKSEVEAKTLLMKALAPVTASFKVKYQGSSDKINWMDGTDNSTESNNSRSKSQPPEEHKFKIRPIESGERAWWLEESQDNSKKRNVSVRSKSSGPAKPLCNGNEGKLSEDNGNNCEEMKNRFIRHVDSGERPWWLNENAEVPEGITVYPVSTKDDAPDNNRKVYKIRHIDSGEKDWWLTSSEGASEVQNEAQYKMYRQKSDDKAWWLEHSQKKSDSETEDEHQLPLGDRASPEGLEMPKEGERRCLSPYENVQKVNSKHKKFDSLFICRHQNIDEILGGLSQSLSPLMERIFDYREDRPFLNNECEEIKPEQVKIHDSTPQRGIIQPNRINDVGEYSMSPQQQARDSIVP